MKEVEAAVARCSRDLALHAVEVYAMILPPRPFYSFSAEQPGSDVEVLRRAASQASKSERW